MFETKWANKWNYAITGTSHGGPFNKIRRKPRNKRDAIYRDHDIGYSKLGPSAYFRYNRYDKQLIDRLNKSKSKWDIAPRLFFKAKRNLSRNVVKKARSTVLSKFKKYAGYSILP